MTSRTPDHFKTQNMCNKAVEEDLFHWRMSQIILKHKARAAKQLEENHFYWKLSLII